MEAISVKTVDSGTQHIFNLFIDHAFTLEQQRRDHVWWVGVCGGGEVGPLQLPTVKNKKGPF